MKKDFSDLNESVLIEDLVTHQRRFISLRQTGNGDFYLVVWMDCVPSESINIWLWVAVDPDMAIQYVTGKMSLYQCMQMAELLVRETQMDNGDSTWEEIPEAEQLRGNPIGENSYITDIMDSDVDVDALVHSINDA
ncbi:hypothetical protein [Acidithiobacillus thiooxidans]|uniref:Uncharacterized protein n=3 Tax=Acidithiobacillus thiooxidans TaxID=930 RepID=A0A1C2HUT1_ACITH|nr:hypothetical protein [Acidithiobacillus thiooxidans]MDX5935441.1 hypothetical protein [Acidithiobacillus thiooxidans]OCX67485.1 hypothetical protein A6O24_20835 [Acidithiobacillus thiooxidans]OCX76928.1 hypothetical protein A6P07_01310 [Acidithiobacillus thiooxidans]OCX85602.1 hypothetical protein A6O26_00820 [Acidithiobacillus thiooxidans]OCX86246.1 hypothetical protein A6M27_13190 [Acidithiobacillus thiooxidans]